VQIPIGGSERKPMPRPRTPTAMKHLKGTAQPCRLNPSEPRPTAIDVPPMPGHLPDTWRETWDRMAGAAAGLRCLTASDLPALEQLVGVAVEVEKLARSRASTVKARKALVDLMARFGLTPADRSRVSAVEAPAPSELDEFAPPRLVG
jgi:hypothetical protein